MPFWQGIGVVRYSKYITHGFFLINHQHYNDIDDYLYEHIELRKKIQNGNMRLLIDCIGESFGNEFYAGVISDLTPMCEKYNFPLKSIVFVDGGSTPLTETSPYFISLSVPSFEYISSVWFGDEPEHQKIFSRDYINLGRKPRPHRILFAHLLSKHLDLTNTSLGSSEAMTWDKTYNWPEEIDGYLETYHPTISINLSDIQVLEDNAPYNIDAVDLNEEQSFKFSPSVINEAFLYVINETYSSSSKVFITEKTWRPIQAKMPFVIFGDANTLATLKSLGYKTFDRWWDESYDLLIGYDRAMAIIKILHGLQTRDLQSLYDEMRPTIMHNYQIFKSNYRRSINTVDNLLNSLGNQND